MKTAMNQMLDELMAHEYTIPLELIVKCKELIKVEWEQTFRDFLFGQLSMMEGEKDFSQYYNKTYTNGL